MLSFGAHMSIAKGFAAAAEKTALELGGNTMQLFTKSPRGGSVKPLDPADVAAFKKLCAQHKIRHVIAHSSYLLNFAKPLEQASWIKENIMIDFQRLAALGGQGIVVHIGKALDGSRETGLQNVIENAKKVIHLTEKILADGSHTGPLQYILENTAGQGSELGFRFEELAIIWKGLRGFSPRIKSCLDTAHIWGAGYDIGSTSAVAKMFKEYDQAIGLDTLACIHFNDSKKPLGSKLDRHENIGAGHIPLEGLKAIAAYAEKNNVPLVLETPEVELTHLDDVKTVRGFF